MASVHRFFKDSVIYTLASWASKVLGFVLIPLYTRIFTPADYGVLDLLLTSILFLSAFLELGLNEAVTRFFSVAKQESEQQVYFATVFWVKVLTYLPVLALLISFSDAISRAFFGTVAYQPLIVWALGSVFTSGLWLYFLALYRLRSQSLAYSLLSVAYLLSTLLLTIYFVVVMKSGVIGVYRAKVLTDIMMLSGLIWRNRQLLRNADFSCLHGLLRFGLPLMPSAIFYTVLEYLDRYFIQAYWGATALGIYAIAYKLATLLTLVTSGFDTAWTPFMYAIHAEEHGSETIGKVFKGFAFLTALLAFGISLFSKELLMFLTTPQYQEASPIIPIVIFALVVYATTIRFCVGIGIRKKTHYHVWGGLVAALLNAGLNWLLIPKFGITGAAWATFGSHALYGSYVMFISQRLYPVNFGLKRFGILLLIFMGSSRLVAYIEEVTFGGFIFKLLILMLVGGLTPLLIGFITRIDVGNWYQQIQRYVRMTPLLGKLGSIRK